MGKDTFIWNGKMMRWNDKHLLIDVNVQLGLKKIPDENFEAISNCFKIKYCVGIMGGKGHMGLYFPGCQGKKLLLMDPHFVQESIDEENVQSHRKEFSCQVVKSLKMKKMDPSIGIGFLVSSIT